MFIPLALVLLVTGLFWLCSAPRSSSPQVPLPVKGRFPQCRMPCLLQDWSRMT